MDKLYKGTIISAVQGDITKVTDIDAIALGADESLYLDSGVCKAVHKIAGPKLREAVDKIVGAHYGEAFITDAYDAPFKGIVHAAVPKWDGGDKGELDTVASCYKSIFTKTADKGLRSVAVPSLGTGAYHYPVDEAIDTALKSAMAFVDANEGKLDVIRWVLFDEETYLAYEAALKQTVNL